MSRKLAKGYLLPFLVLMEVAFIVFLVGFLFFLLFSPGRFVSPPAEQIPSSTLALAAPRPKDIKAATIVLSPGPAPQQTVTSTPKPVNTPTSPPIPATAENVSMQQGKIVFTCTPEKFNQLCMMNADGSQPVRLTSRSANDYYPSFAPDGKSVAFVSNQSGNFEIYTLDLQTKLEQRLTDGLGNVTAPEISPDSRQVVFANKFGGTSFIWLMQRDGSQPHSLTSSEINAIDPTWSPNVRQIAFAGVKGGFVELFVMDADGSHLTQVTHGISGIGGRSSWSPDGKRLAFYAGPRSDRDVYVVEIASGKAVRLTSGGNNTGPCFSPDGQWIAFATSRNGAFEIYIIRADGSQVIQLTSNTYDDWQPRWGP